MAEAIPLKDTYKAIVDRFPKSLATTHIKSNKNHEVDIVKAGLGKIINGTDKESGYTSYSDTEDAKILLGQLENMLRQVR